MENVVQKARHRLKMLEKGTITYVKDNLQLARAMCRLMQTPRLSAADLFYGQKVRSPFVPSLTDNGICRISYKQWEEVCMFKEDNRARSMLKGPKGRKSRVQLSFKNDYVLETDNTAELKVGDHCLVYDVGRAMWTRDALVSEVRPSGKARLDSLVVDISVPYPFCHKVQRITVVSKSNHAVVPVLRCCQCCLSAPMSKSQRVLNRPTLRRSHQCRLYQLAQNSSLSAEPTSYL